MVLILFKTINHFWCCDLNNCNDVKEWCIDRNIIIRYLSPYSPDLNPFENIFSTIKSRYSTIRPFQCTGEIITINDMNNDPDIMFEMYFDRMRDYNSLSDFKNSETSQTKFKIQQRLKSIPDLKDILLNKYCPQQWCQNWDPMPDPERNFYY